jgi:hypothetical protein
MGDPVSISASVITILQLTRTVVRYLSDVKGALEDRQRILAEVSNVSGILYHLESLSEHPQWGDAWSGTIKSLSVPKGPLEQFRMALEHLASRLSPADGLRKLGKALSWPFQKGEIKEILATIERQKALFSLALQKDHM